MASGSEQRRPTPDELRRRYEQDPELQAEIEFDRQGANEIKEAFRHGVKLHSFAQAWRQIEERGWEIVRNNPATKRTKTELAAALEVQRTKLQSYSNGEASAEVLVCAMASCDFQWRDLGAFPSNDALGLAGINEVLVRVAQEHVLRWQVVAVILTMKQPDMISAFESGDGLASGAIQWDKTANSVKSKIDQQFLPLFDDFRGLEDLDGDLLKQLVDRVGILILRCQMIFAWLGDSHVGED